MGKALHVVPLKTSDKSILMSVVEGLALEAFYVEMHVLLTASLKRSRKLIK